MVKVESTKLRGKFHGKCTVGLYFSFNRCTISAEFRRTYPCPPNHLRRFPLSNWMTTMLAKENDNLANKILFRGIYEPKFVWLIKIFGLHFRNWSLSTQFWTKFFFFWSNFCKKLCPNFAWLFGEKLTNSSAQLIDVHTRFPDSCCGTVLLVFRLFLYAC